MVFLTNQEGQDLKGQLKLVTRQLWDGTELTEGACLVAERLDLETGQLQTLPYTSSGGEWCISLTLAPYEAHAVRLTLQPAKEEALTTKVDVTDKTGSTFVTDVLAGANQACKIMVPSEGPWRLETVQPNILRMGQFHLQASNVNGVILESQHVAVKPFIDQAAELSEQQHLSVQFNQVFGTPKKHP